MGIFVLTLFLPFRWMSIFTGFTFTDAEDFLPLLTLILGLIGVFCIRRFAQKKVSRSAFFLLCLLSLWPILPNVGLFFMAREVQATEGRWPTVMIDDPKNLYGHISSSYDGLFQATNYLEAFSGAWMIIFFALFFSVQSRLSPKQRRLLGVCMFIPLFAVVVDPGNLYAWWLD